MITKSLQVYPGKRPARLLLASSVALLAWTAAGHAEDCLDVQSTAAVADFKPCEEAEPQIDLNAALDEQPASSTATSKADSIPWIANDTRDVPATFSTSATGVSVRTSLGTWRDYNARTASPTLEQPEFGAAPSAFDLPKAPVAPKTPVNVWSSLDLQGYDGSRDQTTRAGFGADYTFNKATIVGVSVEHADSKTALMTASEQDQKASAYLTLKATPLLSVDARTEWQAGNSEFAATSGAADKGAVILAPKLNKSFTLDDGTTLSPFVTYQHKFDVSSSSKDGAATTPEDMQSAGAGVTYSKSDGYSLSVSADVDNLGATAEQQSLSSKFQLSVPLNK